jgi:uncharacterized protein (TIGR03437 family)
LFFISLGLWSDAQPRLGVEVTYVGPQFGFSGLDQVNVLLPRQLAGSGQAGIVLNGAGYIGKTTYIFFK